MRWVLLVSILYVSTTSAASLTRAATQRNRAPSATQLSQGRLLIASRRLGDPNFAAAVVLLLSYDKHGAMGIVINRPTQIRLAAALPEITELRDRPDRVFLGGPVSVNVMVLLIRSHNPPQSAQRVFADVYASGSRAVLRKALSGKPARLRAYAGYAGWAPSQLEAEVARGDWLVVSPDVATVFDTPAAEMWPKLIERFSGEWTRELDGDQSGSATPQLALQMSTRAPSDFASGRELYAGLQLRNCRTPLP
jgi:putative transcriptional regulator